MKLFLKVAEIFHAWTVTEVDRSAKHASIPCKQSFIIIDIK